VSSLAGSATTDSADGFAYRYALVNLNSFAITGNVDLYNAHNVNDELAAENFSEAYLLDRAQMLEGLIARNLVDSVYVPANIAWARDKLFYSDVATDTSIVTPPAAFNSVEFSYPPEDLVSGESFLIMMILI